MRLLGQLQRADVGVCTQSSEPPDDSPNQPRCARTEESMVASASCIISCLVRGLSASSASTRSVSSIAAAIADDRTMNSRVPDGLLHT